MFGRLHSINPLLNPFINISPIIFKDYESFVQMVCVVLNGHSVVVLLTSPSKPENVR